MSGVIPPDVLDRAVEVLRGMAYQHRLHILLVLRAGAATPADLGEVVPANPTVISHHLRHLADAGLILRRRQGQRVYYSLPSESTGRLIGQLLDFVTGGGHRLSGSGPAEDCGPGPDRSRPSSAGRPGLEVRS